MKYEYKKQEKQLYVPKKKPAIIDVPEQKFFSLHGVGDPNKSGFKQRIETLYPLSYGLKFAYKEYAKAHESEFDDYVVFPLEGVWSLTKRGQQLDHLEKDEFEYDVMIRIPDFVPEELLQPTMNNVKEKKAPELIDQVEIKIYPAMKVAQILHVGAYDDEPASFQLMDDYVSDQGFKRISKIHREIYLSDARRVAPEKLRTILRYRIN